eukprot:GHRR01001147.1.p1 GENE.GHRR01001147.1~~GHRR01001147.1.p1  ORF type:complete len:246 (+),score=60.54 GHRR01001147.1:40-777(+)
MFSVLAYRLRPSVALLKRDTLAMLTIMARAQAANGTAVRAPFQTPHGARCVRVVCSAQNPEKPQQETRREFVLNSVNVAVLSAVFNWGAVARPNGLGIKDYGSNIKTLSLCPPSPNCISTAEEINDPTHYVPAWTYNPEDGRGRKNPASQDQAMAELAEVVSSVKPDKFEPKIIKHTKDYLYVEFQSPVFGFIDDVEFYFPPGKRSIVEYRSASRIGESDGNINRKRIKAIRQALEKKGWASIGH